MKILVLHGPNLNMLGKRQPDIYGSDTLEQINEKLSKFAIENDIDLIYKQSNLEGELINLIHQSTDDFIIINAAAYSHTSVALRDALLSVNIPCIEVHISNIYKREPFRHVSLLSDISIGVIVGHGSYGYELALMSAKKIFSKI